MKYDVIIIGAGPAGSAAATFLARNGIHVLLLDLATFPREKVCGDGITPRGVSILESLGVLEQMGDLTQRINYAKVFSPNGRSFTSSLQKNDKAHNYMLTVPRFRLDHILLKNAMSQGAEFQGNCKVYEIENEEDQVSVHAHIDNENHLFQGKYAVIATGANMALVKKQGLLAVNPKPIIAARAYYENTNYQSDCFNFHFNDVPLPGYGWVFPMSNNKMNVGVGIIQKKNKNHPHIKKIFSNFVSQPYMQSVLEGANQLTDLQTYPIRTDFMSATLYSKRTLLIGEAAGIVNPLTGEGIDYAMESGEIAAEHLSHLIKNKNEPSELSLYSDALRKKFAPIFNFSNQIVKSCLNPIMLNTMVTASQKRERLGERFSNILLGLTEPPKKVTAGKVILKIIHHLRKP